MRNLSEIIFILLAFVITGLGQQAPFTNISADLIKLGFSNAAWGDYDHDGDLDFVLAGEPGSTIPVAKVYRNDNGSFLDINAGLPGFTYCSVEWGDYDNDSDLDLLLTGNDSLGIPSTKIFRNDDGSFTDILANLPAVSEGCATWGDFDNDNDLDILIAGNLQSKIMRNDENGIFVDIGAGLPLVQSAFCNWADYNNDGWLDALVGGDLGGTYVTKLFKNLHGTFAEDSAGFIGLSAACAKWGDLNNDGLKDLVLGGMDPNLLGNYFIYKNTGNGHFELIDNYTFNLLNPFMDLGDYDNDGFLDIILIGRIQGCGGIAVTMLYHNDGSFVFSDINTGIQGFRQGSATWGDYNNDGYDDLLFTGYNQNSEHQTEIYINNSGSGTFSTNTAPSVPGNLEAEVSDDNVHLRWHRSTDEQTPANGLSYNVFIGTSPYDADRLNPLSDLSTGYRKVARLGNANKDTSWTIHSLEAGNYFWSVQAVDNGFLGSGFATPQSFLIDPAGLTDNSLPNLEFYPNPFYTDLFIRNVESYGNGSMTIADVTGRIVFSSPFLSSSIDLSGLREGVYFIAVRTAGAVYSCKVMKRK
jgi:hypothetical protein